MNKISLTLLALCMSSSCYAAAAADSARTGELSRTEEGRTDLRSLLKNLHANKKTVTIGAHTGMISMVGLDYVILKAQKMVENPLRVGGKPASPPTIEDIDMIIPLDKIQSIELFSPNFNSSNTSLNAQNAYTNLLSREDFRR